MTAAVPAGDPGARHELKTWPEFFEAVAGGAKPFEVRRNDRGYRVGDTLVLREYHPPVPDWNAPGGYTGREVTRRITYVFDGSGLDEDSVQPGYVVLGLAVSDGVR